MLLLFRYLSQLIMSLWEPLSHMKHYRRPEVLCPAVNQVSNASDANDDGPTLGTMARCPKFVAAPVAVC